MGALVVGLAVTVLLTLATADDVNQSRQDNLAAATEIFAGNFGTTLELAAARVQSLQGLFAARGTVTPTDFGRFVGGVGASPGVKIHGYAEIVSPPEFGEFSETLASLPFIQLVDIDRTPIDLGALDRTVVPVTMLESQTILPRIEGIDLASDPARRRWIEQAVSSSRPVVSDVVGVMGIDGDTLEVYGSVSGEDDRPRGIVFVTLSVSDVIAQFAPMDNVTVSRATIEDEVDLSEGNGVVVTAAGSSWLISSQIPPNEILPGAAWPAIVAGLVSSLLLWFVVGLAGASREHRREVLRLHTAASDKDVFLAAVAHELRTPLTSVVGLAEILDDQWPSLSLADRSEFHHILRRESTELADLVEDLLTIGRIDTGTLSYAEHAIDLRSELETVIRRAPRDVPVTFDLPDDVPRVLADSLRARQVLRNMFVNAARHARTRVDVRLLVDDDTVSLEVRNDGEPIDSRRALLIFEPYGASRPRPGQPGSIGLGLHISRVLSRAMGGDLSHRTDGRWTVFTLTLPRQLPGQKASFNSRHLRRTERRGQAHQSVSSSTRTDVSNKTV